MSYHKLNVYSGWVIWLIATVVFLFTIEPTTSFWDCGEFISSAYKLQVGHPPGAPLFMLLARFFAMWFEPENVAMAMNALSAFCSSFTILFLFWSITHFAKKLVQKFRGEQLEFGDQLAVMFSGAVGALAYTFSDSFWFSAVEGEVYAMSSLFTAVVFWAILKWESLGEKGGSLRWLVLIAYLMGLSIGVHLLNLLAIPAIGFVYYFKRYEVSIKGLITTGVISMAVLGIVQGVIIPGTVKVASVFEVYLVNDLGMAFNSGVFAYIILLIALIGGLLYLSRKQNWPILNLSVVSVMMILIGYSTFALVVIRSAANPPMDENNPENVFTLLSYLNREQYGSRPLLTGQYWNTPIDYEDPYNKSTNYVKSFSVKNAAGKLVKSFKFQFQAAEYIDANADQELEYVEEYLSSESISSYNYLSSLTGFLPRMHSTTPDDINAYKEWSNFKGWNEGEKQRKKVKQDEKKKRQLDAEVQNAIAGMNYYGQLGDQNNYRQYANEYSKKSTQLKRVAERLKPSVGENARFFTDYQIGFMYWRYFMWNFSGKQNDIQGHGGLLNGNWITGLDFIDEEKYGNRSELTNYMQTNRGFNKFYLLPFLLGLIGLIFHLVKAPKDFVVNTLLFLFTGLAIVVYLNQDPFQPRERDYAYVGSFYAFAVWIGLGVCALYYAGTSMIKKELVLTAGASVGLGLFLYIVETILGDSHFTSLCILFMSGITALLFALYHFLIKDKLNNKTLAISCGILGMIVPVLMAAEGWDDHSRAHRRTGVDFAANYLNSLEPDAIIFTNGDNDTFPLWYAQEVEGIRTDVRVVNLSLLQTDWYADQMKRQAYDGKSVPIGLTEEQYRQGNRDVAEMKSNKEYIELSDQFEYFLDDSNFKEGISEPHFLSKKWKITIDSADVVSKGVVKPEDADKIVDEIRWSFEREINPLTQEVEYGGKDKLIKNSILVYDIIRTNNWERPIYFASTIGEEAYNRLEDYFQLEGLAYRLVPIKSNTLNPLQVGRVETDKMFENVTQKFKWGNMDDLEKNIYMDENNLRMVSNLRMQFTNLADALTEEGDSTRAEEVLDKCFEVMPEQTVPYDQMILYLALEYADAGATEKSDELFLKMYEISNDKLNYFASIDPKFAINMIEQIQREHQLLEAAVTYGVNTSKNPDFKKKMEELKKNSAGTYSVIIDGLNNYTRKEGAKGRF